MTSQPAAGRAGGTASLRVLGLLELEGPDGGRLEIPGSTQRRLLAALAVGRNEAIRRERLADLLDVGPGALRKAVSRVREVAGDAAVLTDPAGYRLGLGTDAAAFERDARAARAARSIDALELALDRWRGAAFEGFEAEPWCVAEANRLTALHDEVTGDLVELLLPAGRAGAAIARLEPCLDRRPLVDRLQGLLVRAHAAAGRQAEALRAYQAYRALLADELGTAPSATVQRIERAVAQGWDGRADRGSSGAALVPAGFVAPQPGWIGPPTRLDELASQLGRHRLVSLTGPAGVGKTRLATEFAAGSAAWFPDGGWVVELSSVGSDDDVAAAIAATVHAQARQGVPELQLVAERIGLRRALLILDNAEHVVAGTAAAAVTLLDRCPDLRVLVTSRERLALSAEHVVPVEPLEAADAVRLFAARAESAGAAVTEAEVPIVQEICDRLDRLPLAIELASARAAALGCRAVLRRIDDGVVALGRVARRGHRHATLRDTLEWSYRLLGEPERHVFERAAVFPGTFDLEAAETVCAGGSVDRGSVADTVASLVDKSMVTVVRSPSGPRYRLLQTLRSFALERLGTGLHPVAARHLWHYAGWAEQWRVRWVSEEQALADDAFDREWDNLRAAIGFAAIADRGRGERLLVATLPHAHHRMRTEHGAWARTLLLGADPATKPGTSTHGIAAWWAMIGGEHDVARAWCDAGLAVGAVDHDPGTALCLGVRAFNDWSSGRRDDGRPYAERLRAVLDLLPEWEEYTARRAIFSFSRGGELHRHGDRLAEIAARFGTPAMLASARFYQGFAELYGERPDPGAAVCHHAEGVRLGRRAGAELPESQNLHGVCQAKLAAGADDLAPACGDAIGRLFELRYWLYLWPVVDIAALVLAERHHPVAPVVLGHVTAHVRPWHAEPRATALRLVGDADDLDERFAEGAAASRDEVVALLLEALGSR